MGKKSKRRNGKKSAQKSNVLKIDENDFVMSVDKESGDVRMISKDFAEQLESKESDRLWSDIEQDKAIVDFMIWSLSDNKADLNPKKFAKMNPHMTKSLVKGEISIEYILDNRRNYLTDIETRIENLEFGVGVENLMTGMKFDEEEMEDEFRQQLEDSFTQRRHVYFYDSFHEVVSKWSDLGAIHLEDSLFFGKSKAAFDELFQDMLKDLVSTISSEENEIEIVEKYYFHPTARKELHKTGYFYAQDQLKSVFLLLKEMHSCWRCKDLYVEGEGTETKTLICSGCKCAVYCSRECQVKHWKEGKHDECCESISLGWSFYERRKKRIERALRKERIFTKQITVDGIKRECFLPPCEPIDSYICTNGVEELTNGPDTSMDIYYENISRLACGRKHILFEEETISSNLEEKIRNGCENVISDFCPKSVMKDEIMNMHVIAEILQYNENDMTKEDVERRSSELSGDRLSIDRFITLYICYVPFNLGKKAFGVPMNKFLLEMNVLDDLKAVHEQDSNEQVQK
ncbi:hypothetical protein CTEN210_02825 [Chaetoceros tenuissimus]|uniref:MYND-type domain-containing protein n=1 Tax=Chaetoceros tenuissimus TaxID=426638 RepID=A0AAD3H118_9STRA|nr:hypothetical protein CTEN210_02825 [Chaetoceros tenuissimus]